MSKKHVEIDGTRIELERFAYVVNNECKKHKILQHDLAKEIVKLEESRPLNENAARQYINGIVNCRVCPNALRAKKIMEHLNIDVDYIVNFDIPKDYASKAYISGMKRIEKIFKDSDAELIERVVSYAEFLYSR